MRWILCLVIATACGGTNAPASEPEQPTAARQPGDHPQHAGHERGTKAPLGHRFEKAEDWAPRFDSPERDSWQKPEHVVELMAIEKGMTVADIGAGTGYFLPHLSAATGHDGTVMALDIEPDMVRYMKERVDREGLGNVEPRVVEVDSAGLDAGSVDRILIVNTWHHIPDRTDYATALKKALTARGAIYIVDYTLEARRGPPKNHRLAPDQVIEELEAAGLTAEVVEETLPHQYVVVGR